MPNVIVKKTSSANYVTVQGLLHWWSKRRMVHRIMRLANQTLGKKHDAERNRKKDIIRELRNGPEPPSLVVKKKNKYINTSCYLGYQLLRKFIILNIYQPEAGPSSDLQTSSANYVTVQSLLHWWSKRRINT